MTDDRLILALDHDTLEEAEALADRLRGTVSFYKIGLGLMAKGALGLAQRLKARGDRVFLDMKVFDIPATVGKAVAGYAGIGVDFLTVHGDPSVVRAAVKGRGDRATKILAVTVLTSADRTDLDEMMIRDGDIHEITLERARRAFAAGADGVIASPHEAEEIRALPEARGKLIVTPGVRPEGGSASDQKRVATPSMALSSGADHIVVGRPIWAAGDPVTAAREILSEIGPLQAA